MFESLKEKLRSKIENNSIKSTLTNPKNGDTEVVYLRYGGIIRDWGRIYPPVNEDGSWNIANLVFGGKKNVYRLLIALGLAALALYGVYDIFHSMQSILNSPCVQTCINPIKLG
jgi:hypothetical protein